MKIVDVKAIVAKQEQLSQTAPDAERSGQCWDLVVVKVLTDEGIEGVSFAWGARSGAVTAQVIKDLIRPALIGEDPLYIEKIWRKLHQVDRWHAFVPLYALGPIDIALWDIAGKVAGQPIYKLLGAYRDKVLAYGSSLVLPTEHHYVEQALKCVEQGYRAYKIHPPGNDIREDIRICTAVRKAVGEDITLMLDPVAAYTHEQALKVGRAIEELDFYWFEEPIDDKDLHGYVQLAQALDIPIAGIESLPGSVYTTTEYLVRGAVDIVRSDVSWKGGITGVRKTAALCEAFGVNCEIHTACYALLDAANLHLNCSIKNCTFHEILLPQEQFTFGVHNPIKVDRDGYVHVPQKPGIGLDVDWERIRHATVAEL
jgi:L-alanine-DL-glutamate epimerase-like enolase superfamily enzyme